MDLRGKVAIVTGAGGGGSGQAIAKRLARESTSVVVANINEDRGRETVRLIEAEGGRAAFVHADVRHEAGVQTLIASAEGTFGGLDILVNNASVAVFPETSLEHCFANLQVDLIGAMYGMRYGIEAMRRLKSGADEL